VAIGKQFPDYAVYCSKKIFAGLNSFPLSNLTSEHIHLSKAHAMILILDIL
jgi:hypothetical protein